MRESREEEVLGVIYVRNYHQMVTMHMLASSVPKGFSSIGEKPIGSPFITEILWIKGQRFESPLLPVRHLAGRVARVVPCVVFSFTTSIYHQLTFLISASSDNRILNCFLVEFGRKTEVDAIKEEAMVKLDHKGQPQHTLC
ncbi:hypothetical protein Tco_0370150 [Tanacetum coccineum]